MLVLATLVVGDAPARAEAPTVVVDSSDDDPSSLHRTVSHPCCQRGMQ